MDFESEFSPAKEKLAKVNERKEFFNTGFPRLFLHTFSALLLSKSTVHAPSRSMLKSTKANARAMVCDSSTCLGLAKGGLAVVLTLEALVAGYASRMLPSSPRVRGMAGALASGIFLAITFTHVLPDANELLAHAGHGDEGLEEHVGHDEEGHEEEGHEEDEGNQFPVANVIALAVFAGLIVVEGCLLAGVLEHHGGVHGDGDGDDVLTVSREKAGGEKEEEIVVGIDEEAGLVRGGKSAFFGASLLAGGLSIIGVSLHSLVESLAFGLAPDFTSAISVFVAIMAHRWIVSSALVARLTAWPGLRSGQALALFCVFLFMVPAGVGAGVGLKDVGAGVQGVLVAMAAGAFLYLGVEGVVGVLTGCEGGKRVERFGAFIVGASIMVLIEGILSAAGVAHGH